jgi:hypothetical protein
MIKNFNNKGVAIFITLMLLFLLSLLAIAVLLTSYNYSNICEGQIKRLKAITSAEAGINYVYYQLRTNADDFIADYYDKDHTYTILLDRDNNVPLNSGITVEVWATGPVLGRYTVKSKATY